MSTASHYGDNYADDEMLSTARRAAGTSSRGIRPGPPNRATPRASASDRSRDAGGATNGPVSMQRPRLPGLSDGRGPDQRKRLRVPSPVLRPSRD